MIMIYRIGSLNEFYLEFDGYISSFLFFVFKCLGFLTQLNYRKHMGYTQQQHSCNDFSPLHMGCLFSHSQASNHIFFLCYLTKQLGPRSWVIKRDV